MLSIAWWSLDYEDLKSIDELRPLVGEGRAELEYILTHYTGLILALPITITALAWRLAVVRRAEEAYFAVSCLFGAFFLVKQLHFHYLGSFVMYLPLLVGFNAFAARARSWVPVARWSLAGGGGLVLLAAYAQPISWFLTPVPPILDLNYFATRDLYPRLAAFCARKPGVVLASHRDGHYIRYHTECSVIANLMIITPQHHEKVRLSKALLQQRPSVIREEYVWIDYVMVTSTRDGFGPPSPLALRLLDPQAEVPEGFELISETTLRGQPVAKAFQIHR